MILSKERNYSLEIRMDRYVYVSLKVIDRDSEILIQI